MLKSLKTFLAVAVLTGGGVGSVLATADDAVTKQQEPVAVIINPITGNGKVIADKDEQLDRVITCKTVTGRRVERRITGRTEYGPKILIAVSQVKKLPKTTRSCTVGKRRVNVFIGNKLVSG